MTFQFTDHTENRFCSVTQNKEKLFYNAKKPKYKTFNYIWVIKLWLFSKWSHLNLDTSGFFPFFDCKIKIRSQPFGGGPKLLNLKIHTYLTLRSFTLITFDVVFNLSFTRPSMSQRVKKKNPVPAQAALGAGRLHQYPHTSYQHYSS